MILTANPKAQYLSDKSRIDDAIERVLNSGRYILGEEVEQFENDFSNFIGAKYGIGTGNGTDAIRIALLATGIKPGDEVITPSHTAVATVCGIILANAIPVFCDIEQDYFTIDPDLIPSLITKKTKAILAVHIYGQAADMGQVMSIAKTYKLSVIEDCAQAHGAKYKTQTVGSFGDASCFSFYPTKNLGAIGDGGMVLTNRFKIAKNAKLLRQYGWKRKHFSEIYGGNSRLDEIQAAILRVKLESLCERNKKRADIAHQYSELFCKLPLETPKERANSVHVYHLYAVQVRDRDLFIEHLSNKGIVIDIHYPVPVHRQPAYKIFSTGSDLGNTDKLCRKIVSLPIYPELTEEDVTLISNSVLDFFE